MHFRPRVCVAVFIHLRMETPLCGRSGGHTGTAPTKLRYTFMRNPPPNETNHPRAIHPNETVGAVPVCPPERPHSGVSIRK